jgi:AcrR family transcriptional regulator
VLKKVPQQERSRAMVETILAAATRVLNGRPLQAVNTNLVAEVAGVSIGSLYQYFDSKQAIVGSLMDRHRHDCIVLANTVLTEGGDSRVIDRCRTVLRELLALHERERMLHLNFAQAGPVSTGLATAEHAEHARRLATLLAAEFPHLSDAGSLLHAQALMRIVNTLVHDAITLPAQGRDRLVVEQFEAFVSGYDGALKGRVASRA